MEQEVFARHAVSGEAFLLLMNHQNEIIGVCGPLGLRQLEDCQNGQEIYPHFNEEDISWAEEQEWHYPSNYS